MKINFFIIFIVLILIFYLRNSTEKFNDSKINEYSQNISSAPQQDQTINNYLSGLLLNDQTRPTLYDFYFDERSSSMFNSKQKTSTTVPPFPKVLLPNVGCKNNAETCEASELELKEPTPIELKFINKPFTSLVLTDTNNYCNRNIVNCYTPNNDQGPFCIFTS
jgi:hypothetical protein